MTKAVGILKYILIAIGVAIAIIFVGYFVLFKTSSGRSYLKQEVADQLENTLGGRVVIGELRRGLLSKILLEDVTVYKNHSEKNGNIKNSSTHEPMLTINRFEMAWRPFALMKRRIIIDELMLRDLHIHELPKIVRDEETGRTGKIAFPALPENMPSLEIKSFDVENLWISDAILAKTETISGHGSLRMADSDIELGLEFSNARQSDHLKLEGAISISQFSSTLQGYIKSTKSGILSELVKGKSVTEIEISSPNVSQLQLAGQVGDFGNVNLLIENSRQPGLNVKGSLQNGSVSASVDSELDKSFSFDFGILPQKNGSQINIAFLKSAFGNLSGDLVWEDNEDILSGLSVELAAQVSDENSHQISDLLGSTFSLKLQSQKQSSILPAPIYEFDGLLSSDKMALEMLKGHTDALNTVSGDVIFTIKPYHQTIDYLSEGVRVSTTLSAKMGDYVNLENIAFQLTGPTQDYQYKTQGTGKLAYAIATEKINGSGEVSVDHRFFSQLLEGVFPGIKVDEPLSADLSATGSLNDYAVQLTANLPGASMASGGWPKSEFDAKFQNNSGAINGALTGKSVESDGFLTMNLEGTQDRFSVSGLTYQGSGFSLTGRGRYEKNQIDLYADYVGDKGAQPFPGVALVGDVKVDGGIGAGRDLQILSNRLKINEYGISGLEARLAGPINALNAVLILDNFQQGDLSIIKDTRGEVQISNHPDEASNELVYMLQEFSTLILDDAELRLKSPMRISMAEGLAVENIDFLYGDTGSVTGAVNLAETNWVADLDLSDFPVPSSDGLLNFQLALDTRSNNIISEGSFHTSIAENENQDIQKIAGDFMWDGSVLQLKDAGDDSLMDFDLTLPLKLRRERETSSISGVEMDGAIKGIVRYDGRITPLTNFVPESLSSLEGILNANIVFSGSVKEPYIDGTLTFSDGAYADDISGFSLENLTLQANTSGLAGSQQGTIFNFEGSASGAGQEDNDQLTLKGNALIGGASTINAAIGLNELEVKASPVESLLTSGNIEISGPLSDPKIVGEVDIVEMNVEVIVPPQTGLVDVEVVSKEDVEEVSLASVSAGGDDPASLNPGPSFEMSINADDQIFIRGRGLESEWKTALKVRSSETGDALVIGKIDLRKGVFEFSGRRFDLTEGEISFDQLSPNDPEISLIARYETEDNVVAQVVVSGRASDTKVELTSTPVRPPSDVMALILFGKPSGELTAIESLQTAQALASLGGIGPFGGSGGFAGLRQSTGLDLLNVDFDPDTGASALTVGKYIADGLFVSATQDVKGENGAVQVEYEVNNNVKVETELTQRGEQTLSVNWKKDF